MNLTGEKILKQINLKKNDGYEYLFNNYYPAMCSFCFKIIGSKNEAEDIVQDVFYKLWKGGYTFYSIQSLTSFLYTSVKNASISKLKKQRKVIHLRFGKNEVDISDSETQTIQQLIIEEEYYRHIYRAINKLSPERKKIILLSMEGFTNKEIANKSGVSINTVKTLKLKAYKFLRDELYPVVQLDF